MPLFFRTSDARDEMKRKATRDVLLRRPEAIGDGITSDAPSAFAWSVY
jgi:hypothetical protein